MATLTRFAVTAFLTLMFALGPGDAIAGRPTFTDVEFTGIDEVLSEQCGFPVQVHLQGILIDTVIGNRVMTRGAGFSVTFTNLSTGQAFLYQVSGLQEFSETIDGNISTLTFSFSGAPFRLISPTFGVKAVTAGRFVDTFVVNISTGELISEDHAEHGNVSDFSLTDETICLLLSQ